MFKLNRKKIKKPKRRFGTAKMDLTPDDLDIELMEDIIGHPESWPPIKQHKAYEMKRTRLVPRPLQDCWTRAICEVEINFPFNPPYKPQVAMLNQILGGLRSGENILIEAPTGTGKTAVLLIAPLAWRKHCIQNGFPAAYIEKIQGKFQESLCTCEILNSSIVKDNLPLTTCLDMNDTQIISPGKSSKLLLSSVKKVNDSILGISPDSSNKSKMKKQKTNGLKSNGSTPSISSYFNRKSVPSEPDTIVINSSQDSFSNLLSDDESMGASSSKLTSDDSIEIIEEVKDELISSDDSGGRKKIEEKIQEAGRLLCEYCKQKISKETAPIQLPRIYYVTRTHTQVEQVVEKLSTTLYNKTSMCILSSRKKSCINLPVKCSTNTDEKCSNLISKKKGTSETCAYYGDEKINRYNFEKEPFLQTWDIEDIINFGNHHGACPYYGARQLHQNATITILPYNYVFDPFISSSVQIHLENSIIVVDEGHNIEENLREYISLSSNTMEFEDAKQHLSNLLTLGTAICPEKIEAINFLLKTFESLINWTLRNSKDFNLADQFNDVNRVLKKSEVIGMFRDIGLGKENLKTFKTCLDILQEKEKENSAYDDIKPNHFVMVLMDKFLYIANFVMNSETVQKDYVIILKRININPETEKSQLFSQSRKKVCIYGTGFQIKCMNPSIAFKHVSEKAYSIIMASGTLSPINTFECELGAKFPRKILTKHVVDKDQIFATLLTVGPKQGQDLSLTYKNIQAWDTQDTIGDILIDICKLTPNGVLVFFPSYSSLNNFKTRWQSNDKLDKLSKLKPIFTEPNSQQDFQNVMDDYFSNAKSQSGAILLAVCRGKVSEGIDFGDEAARAVVTIGIPYPSIKDVEIQLKKEYNDERVLENKNYLTGSQWYETQAYRALNQALGRCIRHRNDWGAVIVLDSRFKSESKSKNLSVWLQQFLLKFKNYENFKSNFKKFIDSKTQVLMDQ